MIETRLGTKYVSEFHGKYPNIFRVESESFVFDSMIKVHEIVKWTKENFKDDALMSWEHPKAKMVVMIWYCVSEDDAFAAKMRWL